MAAAALKFKKLKVVAATKAEAEDLGLEDQTSDLTLLTRTPALPKAAPAAAAAAPAAAAMFKAAAPKAAAAAAPKAAAAAPKAKPAAPKAAPKLASEPVPKKKFDLSEFEEDEELQELALDVLAEESKVPYRDKAARPIYPLQTRMGFQKQILRVFREFIKIPEREAAPDYDACKKQGAAGQQALEAYEYQKFVRDYIRNASPYRGLLVYHGLGSGKTCSSIAAAEALLSVSNKRIIVMTPSSLRDSFIREITFCGFQHFRLQNYWVRLDKEEPLVRLFASEVLRLPASFIKKATDIWVPDFQAGAPNFNTLSDTDRQQITKQLLQQITHRITFINYNGISASKLKKIACAPPDADGNGFFDNAVIVVDEIHNLTRLMQGTIEPYLTSLPGLRKKIPLEPITPGRWEPELCKKVTDPRRPFLTNYKRGYLLYRLLTGARNSKIIGLSGTPLINFPEEIAILMNLLGGYIHTSSFSVSPGDEKHRTIVKEILTSHEYIDFEEVEPAGLNLSVLFTLLPEGMKKATAADGTFGVQRVPFGTRTPTIQEVTSEIVAKLATRGVSVVRPPEFKSEPLLPPVGEQFRNAFLAADGSTLKNTFVIRKRIQGLISYYRGSKKELMPAVTKDEVVRIPFSPYAQSEYQRVRGEELKQQLEQKKPEKIAGVGGKMANLWAQLYELGTMRQPNSYRMFSRQACNFAFPEGIARPRPRDVKEVTAELGKDKEIVDDSTFTADKEGLAITKEELEEEEDLEEEAEEAEEEDAAIDEAAKAAAVEEARAEGKEEEAEALAEEGEGVLIEELAPKAAAPLPGAAVAAAAAAPAAGKTLTKLNKMRQEQAKEREECKAGLLPGEPYPNATRRAKKCLKTFATPRMRLYPLGKKTAEEVRAGTPPNPEGLMKYSPKYAAILQRILEGPGSSLVYSQFLDMEGIGIFTVALDCNEFEPIVIEMDEAGNLSFSPLTIKSLQKGTAVNRYIQFTGGEERQVRSMALKVFNARYSEQEEAGGGVRGAFTELPPAMSSVLVEAGFKGNTHGELCRVLCITSAGAEGLNLKNVRRVHIMEPYWNHVRTDQVKGRAVRICSHIDLDWNEDPALNERTVEVYTYCSVFSPAALADPAGVASGFPRIDQTLLVNDGMKPEEAEELGFPVAAGTKTYVMTSDEYLFSISERKKKVLENIQNLMKTSAVDCQINDYENKEEGLECVLLPGTPAQYAFHPILAKDIAETSTRFREGAQAPAAAGEAEEAPAVAEAEEAVGQAPAAAAVAAPAPVRAAAKPKGKTKARVITIRGVTYIAKPVLEKGQGVPLVYDLYSRDDEKLLVQLGTTLADPATGLPTADGLTLF